MPYLTAKMTITTDQANNANRTDTRRYVCTRCGNCCRWPGYVRVTAAEVDAIAKFLGLSTFDFIQQYTMLTRQRDGLSLIEGENKACIFLDAEGDCRINPVKPQQCRDFPNGWSFPGFRTECCAIDTEHEEIPPWVQAWQAEG
jgi:Fe-S-cluster containining protein